MKDNGTDPKTLSKRKTIVRARLDSLGALHQEVFPVVYANGAMVYYKIPGKDELERTPLRSVLPDLPAALVMERLRSAKPGAVSLYWNPAPEGRIRALSVASEATALAKAMDDATAAELNSRQQEKYWKKRHADDAATLAMRREDIDRAEGRWNARLAAQADAINAAIAASGPVEATFVHSGECLVDNDDTLKTFNYEKAHVLSADADGQKRFGRVCLACAIRFPGWPKSEFIVPDYTLIDLYGKYPEFDRTEN